MMKKILLSEIAKALNAEVYFKGKKVFPNPESEIAFEDVLIEKIASLEHATGSQLSFLSNTKYAEFLAKTRAGAVIVNAEALAHAPNFALLVKDPYLGFAKAAQLFAPEPQVLRGIHPSACVAASAKIAKTAAIGPQVVIGEDVEIGEDVKILATTVIAERSKIGARSLIYPQVSIYAEVTIGEDCIIHSGAVIGSDGFGLAREADQWLKIPQLGRVNIGNRVEIGANSTIDRGALGDTELHDGVKIDNLVQIAHNVIVGENTAIAAHVGISGSVKIGKNCILAGKVGVAGHLELADGVILTGDSNASKSIVNPGVYSSGIPAKPQKEWARILAQMTRLDKLQRKFLALQQSIKK